VAGRAHQSCRPPATELEILLSRQPDRPNPPLPDEVCGEIGKHLQLTLVELIALSLAGKQLQWTSYGREFASVHRHLGELVYEWRALEDVVAGRAATIGVALDGTAAAVIEFDDHRPLEPGFTEVGSAIERLCSQLWDVAFRVRQREELLGALDAASQHMLIDVQRKLEGQLWMLRAQMAD
jgi:starvation-inducible DNA-binding protein